MEAEIENNRIAPRNRNFSGPTSCTRQGARFDLNLSWGVRA